MENNTQVNKFASLLEKKQVVNTETTAPITPSQWYSKLTEPGAISRILEAALSGNPETPLVKTASHVNRSECLKAAKAAVLFAELYDQSGAQAEGLSVSDFVRLMCRLTIEAWTEPPVLVYQAQIERTAQDRAIAEEGLIVPPAAEPIEAPALVDSSKGKGKGKNAHKA